MEHTELPWHNPKCTRRDGNNACWIMDGGKRPKAICRCCGPNAEANAEYIVRACKAFPAMEKVINDLIEANQHARDLSLNRDEPHRGMIWGEARSMLDVAKLKAKAALAAGGE